MTEILVAVGGVLLAIIAGLAGYKMRGSDDADLQRRLDQLNLERSRKRADARRVAREERAQEDLDREYAAEMAAAGSRYSSVADWYKDTSGSAAD